MKEWLDMHEEIGNVPELQPDLAGANTGGHETDNAEKSSAG